MPTHCIEAAKCSGIRNNWPVPTRVGKPDKPDRTSGPPRALLRRSRSPKSPRPECASEPPWGYERCSTPFRAENVLRIVFSSQVTFARRRLEGDELATARQRYRIVELSLPAA